MYLFAIRKTLLIVQDKLFMFTAYRGLLNNPTKNVRDSLVNHCAQILACYRKNCASPSSAGQVNTAVVLTAAKNSVSD